MLSDKLIIKKLFKGYDSERLWCIYCGNFGKDKFSGHGKSCLALEIDKLETDYKLLVAKYNKACNNLSMINDYEALEIDELTGRAKRYINQLLEELEDNDEKNLNRDV